MAPVLEELLQDLSILDAAVCSALADSDSGTDTCNENVVIAAGCESLISSSASSTSSANSTSSTSCASSSSSSSSSPLASPLLSPYSQSSSTASMDTTGSSAYSGSTSESGNGSGGSGSQDEMPFFTPCSSLCDENHDGRDGDRNGNRECQNDNNIHSNNSTKSIKDGDDSSGIGEDVDRNTEQEQGQVQAQDEDDQEHEHQHEQEHEQEQERSHLETSNENENKGKRKVLTISTAPTTISTMKDLSSSHQQQQQQQEDRPGSSLIASDDIDILFSAGGNATHNTNPDALSPLSLQDEQGDAMEYFDGVNNDSNNSRRQPLSSLPSPSLSLLPQLQSLLTIEKQSWKASASAKASPSSIKSWIALSLTLDGRDKITKVLQYASRFLGYYYETMAQAAVKAGGGSTSNVCVASAASATAAALYAFKAKRFRNLYKALNTSRKAFRFGRAVVELEKLKSMGLIHWFAWYIRTAMFKNFNVNISKSLSNGGVKQVEDDASSSSSSSSSLPLPSPPSTIASEPPVPRRVPFPSREDSTVTFHPDTNFEQQQQPMMKKHLAVQQQPPPKLSVPSQISADAGWSWDSACFPYSDDDYSLLNRKISSNMDWNLQENEKQKRRRQRRQRRQREYNTRSTITRTNTSTTTTKSTSEAHLDQLSYLGRIIYQSLSSFIDEDKLNVEGPKDKQQQQGQKQDQQVSPTPPSPPLWKLMFSAMKLMGLAGFWTGDNLAYLYSIGFLDGGSGSSSSENEKKRKMKQTKATLFAARSYFFASVSGLYLSTREFIRHRNGPLIETIDELKKLKRELDENALSSDDSEDDDSDNDMNNGGDVGDGNKAYIEHQRQRYLDKLEAKLEDMKQEHFKNCLALLKSSCDVIVFSNNAGIDLHLKYRGRKMNEGLQCICGIASALTVLYNTFPTSKKKN